MAARGLAGLVDAVVTLGREGRDPGAPERRRLLLAGSGAALAVGLLLAGPLAGAFLAAGGPWAVARVLRARRERYRRAVDLEVPGLALAVADALAGGHSPAWCRRRGHRSASGAAGHELRRAAAELGAGARTEDALEAMRNRVRSPRLDTIVAACLLQRGAGGDLARLLRDSARAMEEGSRLEGELRVATAQARFTGLLVVLLPLGGALLAELASPGWALGLMSSFLTAWLVGIAVVLQVAAAVAIRRLGRARTEPGRRARLRRMRVGGDGSGAARAVRGRAGRTRWAGCACRAARTRWARSRRAAARACCGCSPVPAAGAPGTRSRAARSRRRIAAAGRPGGLGARELMAAKVGAAVAGGVAGAILTTVAPGRLGVALVAAAPAAGFLAPDLWLIRRARSARGASGASCRLSSTCCGSASRPVARCPPPCGTLAPAPAARSRANGPPPARAVTLGIPLEVALSRLAAGPAARGPGAGGRSIVEAPRRAAGRHAGGPEPATPALPSRAAP